ncbi:MAG: S-layer homology domain-containing protein [Deltaproteobacteria bacterium]
MNKTIKRLCGLVFGLAISTNIVFALPAQPVNGTITLEEDWRLTSTLNISAGTGNTITIDGQNKYKIYEMAANANLTNAEGTVILKDVKIINYGTTPAVGSLAALQAAADSITSINAPVKDANTITLPIVQGFTVSIAATSDSNVINTSGVVTPPTSATTVNLALNVAGNGGIAKTRTIAVLVPAKNQSSGGGSSGNSSGSNTNTPTTTEDTSKVEKEIQDAKNNVNVDTIKEVIKLAEKVVNDMGKEEVKSTVAEGVAKAVVTEKTLASMIKKADEVLATAAKLEQQMAANNMSEKIETKVTLEIPVDNTVKEVQATIPVKLMEDIKEKGIDKVEISAGIAKIVIAPDAIKAEGASTLGISVKQADKEADLTPEQKQIVGDNLVFDFNAEIADKDGKKEKVSNFTSDIEIKVPYTLKEGENPEFVTVFFINDNGELENKQGIYDGETKTVSFKTSHFSKYLIKENKVSFVDVSNDHWAKNCIEVLAAKGIIRGTNTAGYAPEANVTRAEFAALLVRVFEIKEGTNKVEFTDVNKMDWYSEAVKAAASAGIVIGDNGKFDPNANISRQDMAVMLARAGKLYKGMKDKTGAATLNFTDNSEISDYARGSISAVVYNKILSGKPGNMFEPKANATRAEAAKMIYGIMNLK